ncbi:MAG: hypothetical protein K8H88_24015 [Sandaracinaceae bacterium]|nr:hypothetical protein [Sandaracinaceae bacterium]
MWGIEGFGYGVAAISIDTLAPVCTAPCDVDLEVATYRFGVSAGQGNAQLAGNNTFSLDRDTTLRLEHEDRTGLRILGWGLFIGGALGGMLGALAPMFATRSDEGSPSSSSDPRSAAA